MTTDDGSAKRVRELERQLRVAERRDALRDATDAAIEDATLSREPLERALGRLIELVVKEAGASAGRVRTFDESSSLRDFLWPSSRGEAFDARPGDSSVIERELDVAGTSFGNAALAFGRKLSPDDHRDVEAMLEVWCEQVDNYLAAIARARSKHQVVSELSDALKDPLLDRGIRRALDVLQSNVELDDLLLAYRHEDEVDGLTLGYKIVQDKRLVHDSSAVEKDSDVDAFMRAHALWVTDGKDADVPAHFGMAHYREEVLIAGLHDRTLVGRLIVTTRRDEFTTFDRDLLERFTDYLRQRIVDFNREWKYLSRCFSQDVVTRLLAEENYVERFLAPKEKEVAVLYCDIAGFTRLSERVLKEPELIGRLIDSWSAQAVDVIWSTGGVFDKMVGDCIIGLWGPPFFEMSPQQACARALRAAKRIRDDTRDLGNDPAWPQLERLEPPIGVSTGLNYCPLFVGLFGPDEAYTGFSSGMNNAARLQGVAKRDEVLCMERFVDALDEPSRFGSLREAKVKNVAEPLRFCALRSR